MGRLPGQTVCSGDPRRPCYKIAYFHHVWSRVAFREASEACQMDGGSLLSIHTAREQRDIEHLLQVRTCPRPRPPSLLPDLPVCRSCGLEPWAGLQQRGGLLMEISGSVCFGWRIRLLQKPAAPPPPVQSCTAGRMEAPPPSGECGLTLTHQNLLQAPSGQLLMPQEYRGEMGGANRALEAELSSQTPAAEAPSPHSAFRVHTAMRARP